MSRILLVAQAGRSAGEFRRPWVRALHARYQARYRRCVGRAARRLAGAGDLTILAARELVDASALPASVKVRYYDEESFKIDSQELARLARHLEARCWPSREKEPALVYRGVWLPDVLTLARGLVLRMEVAEPLGAVERVWQETKPDRLVLLSGASPPERMARLFARRDERPVGVAARGFLWARAYAAAYGALFPREERLRIRRFVRHLRREVAGPESTTTSRVLFVACRPRHLFVVNPLVTAIRAAGLAPHVIASPTAEHELSEQMEALGASGVAWNYLSDYLPRTDARALIRRYRPIFDGLWRRLEHDPRFAGALEWRGLPIVKIARPFLRDSVRRSLLAAVLFQEAAFRALETIRPRAVVITSNRRHAERALALAARAGGVPCLLFSGALVMGRERSRLFDVADRMLVIGQELKDRLVKEQDVDPARVTVVGDPRSNAARLVPPARLRADVCTHFGLPADRPLLTLVSKYVSLLFSSQEKEALYRTLFGAVRMLAPALVPSVIVKVHPNEDLVQLREQVRAWGCGEAVLTKEYDIHRLFGASDAAVMVTSMAGLEAMAMGCPVVAVQTAGKDFEGGVMPPYVSAGAVERVDMGDPTALAATLRRLLTEPAARAGLVERGRRFAARYVHPVDGELARRLLAVVEEIRSGQRGGRSE
jgi:glycosyltransferase involved in cell wall biosynthesis